MCGAEVPQAPVLTAPASSAGLSITAAMGGALGVQQPTACAGSAVMFPLRMQSLQTLDAEQRQATAEEQEILSRYVGWGGIPQIVNLLIQQL